MLKLFINIYIKFFFLMTPFFLLSTFLSMTRTFDSGKRKRIAVKVTLAIIIICIILLLIGNHIFAIFGITLNSFRVGTGILLFLSAIILVQGPGKQDESNTEEDIAVVPLAIPVAVGPATTGALLVMGVELTRIGEKLTGIAALCAATLSIGILLYLSGAIEKVLKKQGLTILSKITGLVLAAIAAEMVLSGVAGFLKI